MKKIFLLFFIFSFAACSPLMLPVKVVTKTGELAIKGSVKTVGAVGKAIIPNGETEEDVESISE